jgi:hypothetical protein
MAHPLSFIGARTVGLRRKHMPSRRQTTAKEYDAIEAAYNEQVKHTTVVRKTYESLLKERNQDLKYAYETIGLLEEQLDSAKKRHEQLVNHGAGSLGAVPFDGSAGASFHEGVKFNAKELNDALGAIYRYAMAGDLPGVLGVFDAVAKEAEGREPEGYADAK